jgi:hypothetical protein
MLDGRLRRRKEIMNKYKTVEVKSLAELLNQYSSKEFDSPFRSKIPLIILVYRYKAYLDELISAEQLNKSEYIFEYETNVVKGKGFPSCTDLMIINEKENICIEAKRTEPEYIKVANWLNGTRNKLEVLDGWISLINKSSCKNIKVEDIQNISYQMIHRTASACSVNRLNKSLVYIGFDLSDKMIDYYRKNLQIIKDIFGENMQVILGKFSIQCSQKYKNIEIEWKSKKSGLSSKIIELIINEDIMKITKDSYEEIHLTKASTL